MARVPNSFAAKTASSNDASAANMTMAREEYSDIVHAHVREFFVGHWARSHAFDLGTIQDVAPGFHVIEVEPGPKHQLTSYVSVGAGFPDDTERRHLEFLTIVEDASVRHVELLAMAAHYHSTGERLDIGHTFPIGEPWIEGSRLDHMLVSLPYPFGPKLEIFDAQGHEAHILWLLPITRAEREYKALHGLEAMEARFEAAGLEYWKPRRKSVV